MYRPYFESAAKFLGNQGIECGIFEGRKISELDLHELSQNFGAKIPTDLSDYLQELGDGFSLQWKLPGGDNQFFFGLSFLEDIKQELTWMQEQLRKAISEQRADITEEASRRLSWLPIIGIGEGGHVFCIDASFEPAPIRYHECYWESNHAIWQSAIASSLHNLVQNWSLFCFSEPVINGSHISMAVLAGKLNRMFDWERSHFKSQFDRGTTEVSL